MRDEQCAAIAEAALVKLSQGRTSRIEEDAGWKVLTYGDRGRECRIGFGRWVDGMQLKGEIIVAWGSRPLAFVINPTYGVTYFDLRFGIHSRILGESASEVKKYLEDQGSTFREFPLIAPLREGKMKSVLKKAFRPSGRKRPSEA